MMSFTKFLIFFSLTGSLLTAAILQVPAEYDLIQEAINDSRNGDTVFVAPGVYYENLNFNGHNILVTSIYGIYPDSVHIGATVINGGNNASVVTFDHGESNSAELCGFEIRNGLGNDVLWEFTGGGITCQNNSSPTLSHLIVQWNNALGGGGMFIQDSSPVIHHCAIKDNHAESTAGGIYCWNSHPTITYTEISVNTADWLAGGLFGGSNSVLTVSNLTVIGNISGDLSGGGIYTNNSSAFISNTITWNNEPDQIAAYHDTGIYPLVIDYCDIQDGLDGVVPWQNVDFQYGDHNISDHPLFQLYMGFQLSAESPCIDAGNPESPFDPDGTIADMGAYYYHQSNDLGDINGDLSIDILDIVRLVNMILTQEYTDEEFAAGDISQDGILNVLDILQLINMILA